MLIKGLKGALNPLFEVVASEDVPEDQGTHPDAEDTKDKPAWSMTGNAVKALFIVFSESSIAHMSRSEGHNKTRSDGHSRSRSVVTTYGQEEVNVSVSPTFNRGASLTLSHSLKDTLQGAYDTLTLTEKEKTEINTRIEDELRHGVYQFVMLRYICSRTRKPLNITSSRDILQHFTSIDDSKARITVDKADVDVALLHCRGGNKTMAMFTRLQTHLILTGHGYGYTKHQTTAVYRAPANSFYQRWFPPAPIAEDVTELCLVYNVAKAIVARVSMQFEIRRAAMLTNMTPESPTLAKRTKEPSLTTSSSPGHVMPKHVTIKYSAPTLPAATNAESSESSADDSIVLKSSDSD